MLNHSEFTFRYYPDQDVVVEDPCRYNQISRHSGSGAFP